MGTEASNILSRIDVEDKIAVEYVETTTWYDGSAINDSKCDGYIYRKKDNKYYRKTIDSKAHLKIKTIADLRNFNGYYEGQEITLMGYYVSGDKEPLVYKFSANSSLTDDGGSVINTSKGCWIAQFQNVINIKHFGIRQGEEILDRLNLIKAYINIKGGGIVFFPNGNYFIRNTFEFSDGLYIQGESLSTSITATVPLATMFSTKDAFSNKQDLIKNGRLRKGLYYYDVTPNGVLLQKGDIIRFNSSRRFTTDWDNGVAQRDYWLDAELMEVDEGTTTSRVMFKQRNVLDFAAADITSIDSFTPNKNNGIDNITLINVKDTATSSICLRVRYSSGFRIGTIKTYNTNYAGIDISASFNTTIDNFEGEGGTPDLQLNYGVLVENGSKYTTINRLKGIYYRHSFSSGGNGFAIPMFCEVISATSNNSTSLGIDCHGNSAYFTFHNISTDYGMNIAGLGHSVLNAVSTFGGLNFISSGKDCYFGNIKMFAQSTMQASLTQNGDPQSYNNCYFDNIYVEMIPNASSTKDMIWETQTWTVNNVYNNVTIVNKVFDTTKTEAQNISALLGRIGTPMTFRSGDVINNYKLVGFPKGVALVGNSITANKLVLEDCVWGEGTILNTMLSITSGNNIIVRKLDATINHTLNIDLANHIRITSATTGAITNVTIDNFTYSGRAFPVGFFINNGAAGDLVFRNWNVTTPTSNTINPTPLLGLRTENIKIYPDTISTTKTGLVKQSAAVTDVTATSSSQVSIADLASVTSPDATDLATVITLANELKAKYNLNVTITNDIKSKYNVGSTLSNSNKTQLNAKLAADRASGQQA